MSLRDILTLESSSSDLAESYYRIMGVLIHALESRTQTDTESAVRFVQLVAHMGKEFGFPDEDLAGLKLGTYLRDIGMIVVPERVLNKPGPLTAREYEMLKEHPVLGAWMLHPVRDDMSPHVQDIILCHHERFDGTGYPHGLAGDMIPLGARICAVCDAWCAMTHERPYRRSRSREQAAAELLRHGGTHFDPDLVAVFVNRVLPRVPVRPGRVNPHVS